MRLNTAVYSAALLGIALIPACGKKDNRGQKAREAYVVVLEDSIKSVQDEIKSCNSEIEILRQRVSDLMSNFTTVANPREVGSYMIVNEWRNRYPLNGTGIVARIDNNNRFELIAANPKPFDRIIVKTPEASAASALVPNDQALNYRTASLTTVMFAGEQADSIGQLICGNAQGSLTLIFDYGKPVASWSIPAENSKMIALTYALYRDTRELHRLERRVPMLHEKINLIRQHKDKDQPDDKNAE